jgi:hypothetical protein
LARAGAGAANPAGNRPSFLAKKLRLPWKFREGA